MEVASRAAFWMAVWVFVVSCSGVGARSTTLAGSVVGEKVQLPEKDAFGRMIPRRAVRIFSLPCSGCVELSGLLATGSSEKPLVLVTVDEEAGKRLHDLASSPSVFLVLDPHGAHVPRSILDYPPSGLRVAADGTILSQESDPIRVLGFLGVPDPPESTISVTGPSL